MGSNTLFGWRFLLTALLVSLSAFSGADDATEELAQRLASLDSLDADILQNVYADGLLLESSEGKVALARPNLRWQIDTPFPQIILLTERQLQIYDADLAQLTVRELTSGGSEIPANLLIRPQHLLDGDYTVTAVYADGQRIYQLAPTGSSALFQMLEIRFAAAVLESIVILDWQSQQTQILFDNVVTGQPPAAATFQLVVPEGTDVIRG
ncbi:MAG: hypothetical protein GWP70_10025 [Proteobacteria bacterium]|nr:hypothetical protein [Pseudomonadota bacterium]